MSLITTRNPAPLVDQDEVLAVVVPIRELQEPPGVILSEVYTDLGCSHTYTFDCMPGTDFGVGHLLRVSMLVAPDPEIPGYQVSLFDWEELGPEQDPWRVLPTGLCPIPGVVDRVVALVTGLSSASIRDFLALALLEPTAIARFWRARASLGWHHAYPGGLAQHSVEVAELIANNPALDPKDRAFGIALALLHDYGKIWTIDGESSRGNSMSGCHETVGLTRLLGLFRTRKEPADRTLVELMNLLKPTKRIEHSFPPAILAMVRAADHMSCEIHKRKVAEAAATFGVLG